MVFFYARVIINGMISEEIWFELCGCNAFVAVRDSQTKIFRTIKLVDVPGYSEKKIARKVGQPFVLDDAIHFRPVHTKFDPVYVMRKYKADAVFRADKMYGVAR